MSTERSAMDDTASTRSLESTIAAEIQADFLTCSICNLPFNKPKAFPCLHTFCRGCLAWHLQKHTVKASTGVYCIFCPICKQVVDVPTTGVDGLPDNDLLKSLLDVINAKSHQKCQICGEEAEEEELAKLSKFCCIKCEEFLCEDCADSHKHTRATRDHLLVHIESMQQACESLRTQNMYKVTVRQLHSFGSRGDDLHNPTAVCVTGADDIIVSNGDNTLNIFSQSGEVKKKVDQSSFKDAEEASDTSVLNKGVGMTTEGYIATAMRKEYNLTHAHVGVIQSIAGREINICSIKTTEGKSCQPYGIAISEDNFIVISDIGRHCVYIFNPECVLVRQFGKKGKGSRQFRSPYHIHVSPSREIIVSDYENHTIKVFDFKANLKFQFGGLGKDLGKLNHPMGVTTDKFGHIIVADRDNHRVQMFNRYGVFTTTLVEDTRKDGLDIRPEDVAITSHCHLILLLKGIEGVDFAEIRIFQYGPSRWIQDGQLNLDQDQLKLLRKSVGSVQLLAQSTATLPRGKQLPIITESPLSQQGTPRGLSSTRRGAGRLTPIHQHRSGSMVPGINCPSPAPSSASTLDQHHPPGGATQPQNGDQSKLCTIL